jgi:hypothetical protein
MSYNMRGLEAVRSILDRAEGAVRRDLTKAHPWFSAFKADHIVIPDEVTGCSPSQISRSIDLAAPILFMARGHSGTRALAGILAQAGVWIGNIQDKYALNRTLDSLYWSLGFQRPLMTRLFRYGVGCLIDEQIVTAVGLECLIRHLGSYAGGPWGFKTCAGMFCHSLYRYLFPRARYIYLIRDGRDVVLSENGFFHLTKPQSRRQHWEFFKFITFGISDDVHTCPFRFPEKPHRNDAVMQNRFWIQAKSWREHVRMVERLRETGQLSPSVFTMRYEELCRDPIPILQQLFGFLEIDLATEAKEWAVKSLHTASIGRWKKYEQYVNNCNEDIQAVFASMEPELELLGYTE